MKDCYAALGCIHGRWQAGGGSLQGLHRDAEVQPLPELAHHGHRARRQADRGADPHPRDAPAGRVGRRRALGVQGRARRRSDIDWLNRIIDWQAEISDPAAVHGEPEDRPRAGRGLRLHAEGPGRSRCRSARPRSTSPTPCTPRSATRASAPRSTVAWCRSTTTLRSGDTCEIFTSKVETAGPSRDWLQFVESPRARNKIRQWFSRERRVDMIEAGREELTKEFRREGLPVQRMWAREHAQAEDRRPLSYADLDAVLAAIGEHHVSAAVVAQRVARGVPRRRRGRAARRRPSLRPRRHRTRARQRSASTSRVSTTCWCACRAAARRCPATTSSASSPVVAASACTAPTAPTRCR